MEAAIFNCQYNQTQDCEGGCETIYYLSGGAYATLRRLLIACPFVRTVLFPSSRDQLEAAIEVYMECAKRDELRRLRYLTLHGYIAGIVLLFSIQGI